MSFVKTGNANGPELPWWPMSTLRGLRIMRLGARAVPRRRSLPPLMLRAMRAFIAGGGRPEVF